jgi:antitoxin (DNA-binding transcriptional repressor) of toxin-antitoxin stability system
MRAVGTKALKNELSRYLKLVREGEVVLVLDRDEVIAEIRRPRVATPVDSRWERAMAEMEADGLVRRARGAGPVLRGYVAPTVPDGMALLKASRGDRG